MRCWPIFALVLALGCESAPPPSDELPGTDPDSERGPTPAPPTAEVSIAELFPLQPGDRWRETVAGTRRTRGVTAVAGHGVTAVLAQMDRRPSLFLVGPEGASLVTPQREVVEPILRPPLREGATFSYALGQGAQRSPCEATVETLDAEFEIAGATLEGCVEITRRCRHPAVGPFAEPTLRTTEEAYCPRVGRVRSRTTLEPPLPGSTGPIEATVVRFQTSHGPALPAPERFGCDAFLLLPSDVAAACGPEWTFAGESGADDGCVHRFAHPSGAALEVRAARRGSDEDAEAAVARVRDERGDALRVFAEGAVVVQVEERAADEAPQAECAAPERLDPLLRSLVRQP